MTAPRPSVPEATDRWIADPRVQLFALWIAVMFNYLYADILGLMDAEMLAGYLAGEIDGLVLNEGFLFGAGVLMQLPTVMVLVSRLAPRQVGRWANIVAGLFSIVVALGVLSLGNNTSYYLLYTIVEIVMLMAVVVVAWRWQPQEAEARAPQTQLAAAGA